MTSFVYKVYTYIGTVLPHIDQSSVKENYGMYDKERNIMCYCFFFHSSLEELQQM